MLTAKRASFNSGFGARAQNPFEAAEQRPTVAYGETVGKAIKQTKPRMGRKKCSLVHFLPPRPGLKHFVVNQTHGFTVSCFLPRLRR
jgi:hypothetical protein